MSRLVENQVEKLTRIWSEKAKETEQQLNVMLEKLTNVKSDAMDTVSEFNEGKYTSFRVTPVVVKLTDEGELLRAQRRLHIASYKTQELSAKFKTRYNIVAIEVQSDANALERVLWTSFSTDSLVNKELSSNASIERFYGSIAVTVVNMVKKIQSDSKCITELSNYVEEQLYAHGRLDGVLRYHKSLSTADAMNSANRGTI